VAGMLDELANIESDAIERFIGFYTKRK